MSGNAWSGKKTLKVWEESGNLVLGQGSYNTVDLIPLRAGRNIFRSL